MGETEYILSEYCVLFWLKNECKDEEIGTNIDKIKEKQMEYMNENEINLAIDSLIFKGYIYSTIDNKHFKPCI